MAKFELPNHSASAIWDLKTVVVQRGVKEDQVRLEKVLSFGYEPFSVTRNGYMLEYHFRKLV